MTPTELFWYRVGRWARMELTADQLLRNFPTPHTDYLIQYVDYPIPENKASDLVAFDGSVIVDRTAGQIGGRWDHEAYNTLTINLALEIIEGRRSVEDARRLYGETANAFVLGRRAPYAEGLLFAPLRRRPRTRTSPSLRAAWRTRSRRRSRTPSAPDRLRRSGTFLRSLWVASDQPSPPLPMTAPLDLLALITQPADRRVR